MENTIAFDLRYHHIGYIYELARNLCGKLLPINESGEWIPFYDIYKYPEIGRKIAYSVATDSGYEFAMKANVTSHPTSIYWADMVGMQGEYTHKFIQASAHTFSQILLTSPNQKVVITNQPDIICRECQIYGNGKPGLHCLEQIDDFNNWDFYYRIALDTLHFERKYPQLIKSGASDAFITEIGLLRSIPFLEDIEKIVTLGHKQVQRSMVQYAT